MLILNSMQSLTDGGLMMSGMSPRINRSITMAVVTGLNRVIMEHMKSITLLIVLFCGWLRQIIFTTLVTKLDIADNFKQRTFKTETIMRLKILTFVDMEPNSVRNLIFILIFCRVFCRGVRHLPLEGYLFLLDTL